MYNLFLNSCMLIRRSVSPSESSKDDTINNQDSFNPCYHPYESQELLGISEPVEIALKNVYGNRPTGLHS